MVRSYLSLFDQLSTNVKLFLLGNAIQGMGMSVHGLLFNLYLKEIGFGESVIGSLISTTSLGISLMAIPAALIVERFHAKYLVITGMLLCSVFLSIQILNSSENGLFTFGLMASMFQALFNISVSPFYLRNSKPELRVQIFTLNSSLNILAHMFGYLIGGYLPEIVRWFDPSQTRLETYRGAIIMSLVVVLCSNFLFMRLKRVAIPKHVKKNFFQGLKEKEWKILSRLIAPKLCLAFGGGMVVPFLNLYLKERFHLSTKMIGVSYAALQLFIFIGIFVTPSLIKKTTHLRFITFSSMLAVPFMLTMGIASSVGVVLSCFFLRGVVMNMSAPITSVFEMEHVKETECAFASAIIIFFYHLVYMFSTRIGGIMIEAFSFGPTFYIAAGFYGLGSFLYFRLFKHEEVEVVRPLEIVAEPAVEAA